MCQAVVAMQILAERGLEGEKRSQTSLMSEALVEERCHEVLFQILEGFDDDEGEETNYWSLMTDDFWYFL